MKGQRVNIPTQTLKVELYAPTTDAHNSLVDAWATPQLVEVYGWASAAADPMPVSEGFNHQPVTSLVDVWLPRPAGNPRARWTLSAGVFEQVGYPTDFRHGPWWSDSGAVVRLRKIKG